MRRLCPHLSVLLLGATAILTASAAPQTVRPPHNATFEILANGVRLGSESVSVTDTGSGWVITSTGRLVPPVDLTTAKFEVSYTREWQPQRLTIDGTSRGAVFTLSATFTDTTSSIVLDQSGQRRSASHTVSPRTVVLPRNIFSAYEALAIRLSTATVGTRFPAYITEDAEMTITLTAVTPRRMTSPAGTVDLRQCDVTFTQPGSTTAAEIWIDREGYLARFVIPAQGVAALRSDLTSVMMREERITHPGDESVFIPSLGFSLGGTLTKPTGRTGRLPAVVLVGSGAQDRDETAVGIPIFGQLAGALADAGFAVVRYDRRGSGQSGGRTENATLTSYADDLVKAVEWLRQRKDIDPNRITVMGYGEGGPLALIAASRSKEIDGVVLLAAPGSSGRDVVLELQAMELARSGAGAQEQAAKIIMQRRVLDALATGKGWDSVPADVRKASDTPWFKSWVLFDPAVTLTKVPQPVLIVHGLLDRQILPGQADRLERAARARKPSPRTTTNKVLMPGVNHLFVNAKTGEIDEYVSLPKTISPELAVALAAWMNESVGKKQ